MTVGLVPIPFVQQRHGLEASDTGAGDKQNAKVEEAKFEKNMTLLTLTSQLAPPPIARALPGGGRGRGEREGAASHR